MSKVTKIYTGIAGLPVCKDPRPELVKYYKRLLRKIEHIPKESHYRNITEQHAIRNKDLVESTQDPAELEKILGTQCEELIEDIKKEINLIDCMKQYRPWEGLEEKPPTGQWKWPM